MVNKRKYKDMFPDLQYVPKARGNRFGVPTPMNCKVTHLIHRIENGELKPSFDNLRFFYEKAEYRDKEKS